MLSTISIYKFILKLEVEKYLQTVNTNNAV